MIDAIKDVIMDMSLFHLIIFGGLTICNNDYLFIQECNEIADIPKTLIVWIIPFIMITTMCWLASSFFLMLISLINQDFFIPLFFENPYFK